MSYRAALIGCGRIGAGINPPGVGASRLGSHAAAYAASSRVELVAACEPDAERRTEAQRRWNIPHVFATVEEMLAAGPFDIVSVTTPAEGRVALLEALIAGGGTRAILAEKPLAATVDETMGLAAAASRAGVIGAVNYVRRFAPGYQAAAADIRAGGLGDIQAVRGVYTKGVLNNGGHMLDLLRYFFGEPDAVGTPAEGRHEPDPTVTFGAFFDAGFEAWVQGLDHAAFSIFELDIIGTRGRIVFGDLGHRMLRWDVEDTMARHGFRQLSPEPRASDPGLTRALEGAVENLTDCLDGSAEPLCTFDDGRAALALALSLRDQARQPDSGLLS